MLGGAVCCVSNRRAARRGMLGKGSGGGGTPSNGPGSSNVSASANAKYEAIEVDKWKISLAEYDAA